MKRELYCAAVAAITTVSLAGCGRNDQANTDNSSNPPGQTTADKIQNGADKTGQALKDAAHNTGEALNSAATRTADLAQKARDSMSPATQPAAAAPDMEDIRSGIAALLNDAVAKNSFSSLVKDFSPNTRARFGESSKQDFADIDGIVDQIQKDWNAKYGHDFKANEAAFNASNIQVRQGAYANGTNIPNSNESGIGTPTATRDTAVVTITLDNGSTLDIPMMKEGILRSWKLDVPPNIDAQKLHDNLSKALTHVKDSSNQWPSDEAAAYRLVAQNVLGAILDSKTSI